jgi:hypothetical protein
MGETSIGLPGLALEVDVLIFSDSMEHHLRVFDDGRTDQTIPVKKLALKAEVLLKPRDNL